MKPTLEFSPILLFFAAYKFYDIYVATGVLIVATVITISAYRLIYRKIETMHWVTLVLVLVFGGATLYLHDEQFIKWKLTIIEWLLGSAVLASQFIGDKTFMERMMGANIELPGPIWRRLNLSWAIFFFSVGAINLYVMNFYNTDDWVNFKTFGVPGMMLVFLVLQVILLYKHLPQTEADK